MKKIILLKGLVASGKSTIANELCKEKRVARVNRDLLREMFNYGVYTGKNEQIVVSAELMLVKHLLNRGMEHVIVDDCNLNPKNEDMWRNLSVLLGADFEIKEVNTDVDECIKRDKERANPVGESVITNMALQYGLLKIDKPVVICDIDGTIADIKHRLHHLKGKVKDWKGFFNDMDKDTLRNDVHQILLDYEMKGCQVIFVSARPEDYRSVTERWLERFLSDLDSPRMVLMRRAGDSRDDAIVKKEIYEKYLSNLNITTAIDDRPKIVRLWEELGVPVIDVGEGVEF